MPLLSRLLACALCMGASESMGQDTGPTAAGFLQRQGETLKVRWRSHYLTQPPSPSTDRQQTALALGILLAEAELIVQSQDAQQFRNNTQEVIAACRSLGLGDSIMPRLMTQAQMAQQGDWAHLSSAMGSCQDRLQALLREQRDPDLARFVQCGNWLRLLQILLKAMSAEPKDGGQRQAMESTSQIAIESLQRNLSSLSAQALAGPLGLQLEALCRGLGSLESASNRLRDSIEQALRASAAAASPGGEAPR